MEGYIILGILEKSVLITGAAGFIGANLILKLLDYDGIQIIGLDNLNEYYDVNIKKSRIREIEKKHSVNGKSEWFFVEGSIADRDVIRELFDKYKPNIVVNLAAQAGIRYSIENPDSYIESNIIGFYNILEACRHSYDNECVGVEHLVYASSSSVYGSNCKTPYSESDRVDTPISLYAASKKSNELMAHAYSKLYSIPTTGLRFFTVYGPAGRPDMAYFKFTEKLVKGEKIKLYNYGNCKRDFTYITDVIDGIVRVIQRPPQRAVGDDGLPIPPYKLYNIGNSHPEKVLDFIDVLKEELVNAGVLPEDFDIEQYKELVPMQPGDVLETCADTTALQTDFGYKPTTQLREGLREFARWYKLFYNK